MHLFSTGSKYPLIETTFWNSLFSLASATSLSELFCQFLIPFPWTPSLSWRNIFLKTLSSTFLFCTNPRSLREGEWEWMWSVGLGAFHQVQKKTQFHRMFKPFHLKPLLLPRFLDALKVFCAFTHILFSWECFSVWQHSGVTEDSFQPRRDIIHRPCLSL